jgi:hypothetical protein
MRIVVPALYLLSRANASYFAGWFGRAASKSAEPEQQETAIPTCRSIKDFNFSTNYESDDPEESNWLPAGPEAVDVPTKTLQQDQATQDERILSEPKEEQKVSLLMEFSDDEDGTLFGISEKPIDEIKVEIVPRRQEPTHPGMNTINPDIYLTTCCRDATEEDGTNRRAQRYVSIKEYSR